MTDNPIHRPGTNDTRQPWLRAANFATPSALAPDQEGRLRRLGEDFCAVAGARAMTELALSMELRPLWTRDATWRDLQPFPADDAVTTTLEASAGGRLYLAIDPTLASLVVERLLGAESDPARPLRAVTTVDRALMSRLNEVLTSTLGQLWEDATATTLTPVAVTAHRELVLEGDPADRTMLAAIEVRLASSYSVLYMLVPQTTVEPVALSLSRPSARGTGDDAEVARKVQARLGQANVVVEVLLGAVRMSTEQITHLQPGDRIPLAAVPADAAALSVDGVPMQYGHIGRSGLHRAVQVGGARAASVVEAR